MCPDCGGEYGHLDWCPLECLRIARNIARKEAEEELEIRFEERFKFKLEKLVEDNNDMKKVVTTALRFKSKMRDLGFSELSDALDTYLDKKLKS